MTSDFVNCIIQSSEYADSYFCGDDYKTGIIGKKETAFMGNLCAFQFWQRVFKVLVKPTAIYIHSENPLKVYLYCLI